MVVRIDEAKLDKVEFCAIEASTTMVMTFH